MIPIEEAEKILEKIEFRRTDVEEVPLMLSPGRVLAADIVSAIDMPPFDKSAMDGYAVISDDNSAEFKITEVIAAGSVPVRQIKKGECAKIMTGAVMPAGADRVVKIEATREQNGMMVITGIDPNRNICYRGEDIKKGEAVLTAGHWIRPPEVGIIASLGFDKVPVYQKAKVGIATTGSEIKEPGQPLGNGQIYNSNSYSIGAQVLQAGASVIYTGIVEDNAESISRLLSKLLEETQMILISGGVSMGEFDFVPGILKQMGIKLYFEKVAIQPGKPTVFGTYKNTLLFGLPGNPVSAFTIFEILVRPVLCRMMGYRYIPVLLKGILKKNYRRKFADRTAIVPVQYNNDGSIEPVEFHGSAHLSALSKASALMEVPRGVHEIPKGSTLYVRQI